MTLGVLVPDKLSFVMHPNFTFFFFFNNFCVSLSYLRVSLQGRKGFLLKSYVIVRELCGIP